MLLLGVPEQQSRPLADTGHDAQARTPEQAGGTSQRSPMTLLATMVMSGQDPSLPGAVAQLAEP